MPTLVKTEARPDPATVQNTKIELVVEAVESLANAVVASQKCDIAERQELRDALASFLAPTLRVVS